MTSPRQALKLKIRGLDGSMRSMVITTPDGGQMIAAPEPDAGKRVKARRGSYRAANNPRTRVQTPYGGSGDSQADPWSRRIIREISRDMDRNSDTYRSLLDDFARAVVGDGVRALLKSKNPVWNKEVGELLHKKCSEARANSLDVRKMGSHYEQQAKYVRGVAADGDAALLHLDDMQVQSIESEQITSGPSAMTLGASGLSFADGVTMTELGAPKSFKIYPYDQKSGAISLGKGEEYDADVVNFVALSNRVSQTRGVPLLVAGIESWERLDSFKESEVVAAEMGAQIYSAVEYPQGNMGYAGAYTPGTNRTGNDAQPPTNGFAGGFSPAAPGNIDWRETVTGAVVEMPDGAKYVPINPQRPNRDAAPFLVDMLRQFCANAGLPYEFVYNDLRGLSWSIQRAMVQIARDKIAVWQNLIFAPAFKSTFKWLLANWIAAGFIPYVDGWDDIELAFPKISWPDEGKEFEAQKLGLSAGLTTRHRLFGPDWTAMLDERMLELEYAAKLAQKFNIQFPDFEVTPQYLLGLEADESTVDGGDEVAAPGKKTKNPEKVSTDD